MKHIIITTTAVLLILLGSLPPRAIAEEKLAAPASADEGTAELDKMRKRIEQMRTNLNQMRQERGDLQDQLAEVERNTRALRQSISGIETKVTHQNEELNTLRNDKGTALTTLASERDSLARDLRTAYAVGTQGPVKMLLSQSDPASVGRNLKYYEYFSRARGERINTLRGSLTTYDSLEQILQTEMTRLDNLRAAQRQRQKALAETLKTRQALLAALSGKIGAQEENLSQLTEDERKLGELVKQLREAAAAAATEPVAIDPNAPFPSLKGKLALPVRGTIAAQFGTPRANTGLAWQGVWIEAPEGTEVRAIAGGNVVFADWLRGFGLMIIVDHGEGYMSLYGHNQELHKSMGETVQPGEVIASVGSTGGQNEPGLYFEIRSQGTPVNPLLWSRAENSR